MKKLLYLFIASTLLFSCDPDETESLDPIIGKWQLSSFTIDGDEVATDCLKETTFEFFEDGTHVITSSTEDDDVTGNCIVEINNLSWTNVGDSTYRTVDGTESYDAKMLFSNNDTVFTNSIIIEIDDVQKTSIVTYKKI